MSVHRSLSRDIHVGDPRVLRVDLDVEILARVRIRTFVAGDAAGLDIGGRRHRGQDAAILGAEPVWRLEQQQSEDEHGKTSRRHTTES